MIRDQIFWCIDSSALFIPIWRIITLTLTLRNNMTQAHNVPMGPTRKFWTFCDDLHKFQRSLIVIPLLYSISIAPAPSRCSFHLLKVLFAGANKLVMKNKCRKCQIPNSFSVLPGKKTVIKLFLEGIWKYAKRYRFHLRLTMNGNGMV